MGVPLHSFPWILNCTGSEICGRSCHSKLKVQFKSLQEATMTTPCPRGPPRCHWKMLLEVSRRSVVPSSLSLGIHIYVNPWMPHSQILLYVANMWPKSLNLHHKVVGMHVLIHNLQYRRGLIAWNDGMCKVAVQGYCTSPPSHEFSCNLYRSTTTSEAQTLNSPF